MKANIGTMTLLTAIVFGIAWSACATPALTGSSTATTSAHVSANVSAVTTAVAAGTATAETNNEMAPTRVVMLNVDRTTSMSPDAVRKHIEEAAALAEQSAAPGECWYATWISSISFNPRETFASACFPIAPQPLPCLTPSPVGARNPFLPTNTPAPPDTCEKDHAKAADDFSAHHRLLVAAFASTIRSVSWTMDDTATDIASALMKDHVLASQWGLAPVHAIAILFSDMMDNAGTKVSVSLRGFSVLIKLADDDPTTYEQASNAWEPTLRSDGALTVDIFYDGADTAAVVRWMEGR